MHLPTREDLIAELQAAKALAIKERDLKGIDQANDAIRQLGGETRFTQADADEISLLAELDAVGTALYRHRDQAGQLLYVGISLSAVSRTAQHSSRAPWFKQITRIDIEWFGSRSSAAAAEKRAIQTEKPLYNVTFTKDRNNGAQECPTRDVRPEPRQRPKRNRSV